MIGTEFVGTSISAGGDRDMETFHRMRGPSKTDYSHEEMVGSLRGNHLLTVRRGGLDAEVRVPGRRVAEGTAFAPAGPLPCGGRSARSAEGSLTAAAPDRGRDFRPWSLAVGGITIVNVRKVEFVTSGHGRIAVESLENKVNKGLRSAGAPMAIALQGVNPE
ncbi:hypothetical protein H9Y04_27475 [Streptomyces sp. TRM66268-LWL]|uniref:Uncharacterized protein n=1 Tax=Streptomyces polyasparticus TaxID=2767826 RepID=A0ABR7SLH3_9ACTN|nr:hypothetical protein [Streptomyces polyasparticus]MBC9716283.1 hypothetical protein [Streptomyces polyasparticus]